MPKARKPVSQASVELIFDNSDHTITGEYAAFNEISVKRMVSRDGQSAYYLNGGKCRRRDITDLFLGTGLGPRSYSIIEQGMISKLIEAKPEDLRNFIEEAAGISKYKERRRETENRIRRTQENLARLTDLREELERQLERLHRQAQAAEKYQEYKGEERQLKAQLSALRWQALNDQVGQREAIIGTQEISFEALVAEQRNADASIERLRDGHHELSERFNQVQGRFYSVAGDIARVEQSIQHGQQRLRQLQDDLKEAERARLETESHLGHDRTLLLTLGEELDMLTPEQEITDAAAEEAAGLFAQLAQIETQTAAHRANLTGFQNRIDEVLEVRQTVFGSHFEQKFGIVIFPGEIRRHVISRNREGEYAAAPVACRHHLDEGPVDQIHLGLQIAIGKINLLSCDERNLRFQIVRANPIESQVSEWRLRSPARWDIQVVDEFLHSLAHGIVVKPIVAYIRSQVGIERTECLRAGPLVLQCSEEVDHLTEGAGKMLRRIGLRLAGNAVESFEQQLP